jgi:3-phosphoshikimate 1-carboxyvinyltransferase
MTISVMSAFGINVSREGYEKFSVQPARYQSVENYVIEPDASAASYFFAAPAILGGSVRVEGISLDSKQGDIAFLDILRQMGCSIDASSDHIQVTGPQELRGVDVDMRDISDTAQTLAAIAPFASSPTTIRGVGFIRAKETDRITAVCKELSRLGIHVEEHADGMTIHPAASIRPALVQTYNDHRMAMAFALIGLRVPGVRLENPACVSKTFPDYFDVLEALR